MIKIIFAITLSVLILAGCGKGKPAPEKNTATSQTEQSAQTSQVKPGAEKEAPQEGAEKKEKDDIISEEAAKRLVFALLQGSTEKDIIKCEKDFDDGKWKYEIEIINNNLKYEFEIDAQTGVISSWESEPVGK